MIRHLVRISRPGREDPGASYQAVYSPDIDVVIKVRDGGATPIKPFFYEGELEDLALITDEQAEALGIVDIPPAEPGDPPYYAEPVACGHCFGTGYRGGFQFPCPAGCPPTD